MGVSIESTTTKRTDQQFSLYLQISFQIKRKI